MIRHLSWKAAVFSRAIDRDSVFGSTPTHEGIAMPVGQVGHSEADVAPQVEDDFRLKGRRGEIESRIVSKRT